MADAEADAEAKAEASYLSILACPSCQGELSLQGKKIACLLCGEGYPLVGGIPFLFKDPQLIKARWHNTLHATCGQLAEEAQLLKYCLGRGDLLEATKKRLLHLLQAKKEQIGLLQSLLSPLELKEPLPSTQKLLESSIPKASGFVQYYDNIFRDWQWGEEENKAHVNPILSHLPDSFQVDNALVLGAGAGRLAFDLSLHLAIKRTYAADINPLMLLVAKRMYTNRALSLYEFPIAPLTWKQSAVKHRMKFKGKAPLGLTPILCDALQPCFKPKSFSFLVTPWFIDILSCDFKDLVLKLNSLMDMGGHWLNFGSLSFFHADQSLCYSQEEVAEILAAGGFSLIKDARQKLPYLNSPHSSQSRHESVYTFLAVKKEHRSSAAQAAKEQPSWLTDVSQPIPLLPGFEQALATNTLFCQILAKLDGKSALRDLAPQVALWVGFTEPQALSLLKQVLGDLWQKQQKAIKFR